MEKLISELDESFASSRTNTLNMQPDPIKSFRSKLIPVLERSDQSVVLNPFKYNVCGCKVTKK